MSRGPALRNTGVFSLGRQIFTKTVTPMPPGARPSTKPGSGPHVRKTGRDGTKWETVISVLTG